MASVLVIGASGYIGLAVSIALRQSGHIVYGLVRNDSASKILLANEIIPVRGDVSDGAAIVAEEFFPHLTHIVDVATSASDALHKLIDTVSDAAAKTPHRKLSYIFTTGLLGYGQQPEGALVTESYPLGPCAPFQSALDSRKALEDKILESTTLRGTVVRPAWVYGGNGGHYLDHLWAYDAASGDYTISGSPSKRSSWIHISDLAAAYVHLVNAAPAVIRGEIFNVSDSTRGTFADIKVAAVKAAMSVDSKSKGVEKGKKVQLSLGKLLLTPAGTDGFSQVAELSIVISSEKLQRFFGWTPKFNFFEGTRIYYAAWKLAYDRRTAAASSSAASSP